MTSCTLIAIQPEAPEAAAPTHGPFAAGPTDRGIRPIRVRSFRDEAFVTTDRDDAGPRSEHSDVLARCSSIRLRGPRRFD